MNSNHINEIESHAHITNEMRLLHEKESPAILLDKEFAIQHGVFHPGVCLEVMEFVHKEIVRLVEEEIAKHSENIWFDFLQVGCGAGTTSILVALSSEKCRVWATDINETAVANAKQNAKLHGVEGRVKPVVADVFMNDEIIGRKFDMVYWVTPWGGQFTDEDTEINPLMKSLIDPGYRSFRRFLSEAGSFLKATGRLIVAFSYGVGSEELFKRIANETGWKLKICSSENLNLHVHGTLKEVPVLMVEFLKPEIV